MSIELIHTGVELELGFVIAVVTAHASYVSNCSSSRLLLPYAQDRSLRAGGFFSAFMLSPWFSVDSVLELQRMLTLYSYPSSSRRILVYDPVLED